MFGISISTVAILISFSLLMGFVIYADIKHRKDGKRIWIYKILGATTGYMFLLWLLRWR